MTTNNRFRFLSLGGFHESAGLLALRVLAIGPLLMKHGFEKVFHFATMSQHFPDPVHIGPVPSLVIAMLADFVCSILIILGLATRWAALFSFFNILVAWAFVHHFAFFARPTGDHGELIVVYLAVMVTLFLTGPGHYSLDYMLTGRSAVSSYDAQPLYNRV